MQSSTRVEREHALGEAYACLRSPREAVPVDGLRLGDARVIHEHEPDPEGVPRQRRCHLLPCPALRLHLTPKYLPDIPFSLASNATRRDPHVLALQHLRPPSGPRSGPRGRGQALFGHKLLAGPPCCGTAGERDQDPQDHPECGDDRVPGSGVRRKGIDVTEQGVADDHERQERHDDLPCGDLALAREEQQFRRPDGSERVDDEQDQGAYGTRRQEQIERRHAEDEPAEDDDDVDSYGDGCRGAHRDAVTGRDGSEWGWTDLVARERVQEPRGPDHARQGATEGADGGADGDELPDPPGDEPAAEVAEQRAGRYELLDALRVGPEAHHLDSRDEDVVQAAEDGDPEDRAGYVAAGLLRLLA